MKISRKGGVFTSRSAFSGASAKGTAPAQRCREVVISFSATVNKNESAAAAGRSVFGGTMWC